MLSVDEFFKKYEGKKIDWDGVSPYQCVDLAKAYIEECYGIPTKKGAVWGNAKDYFLSMPVPLKSKFTKIANTPEFVPKKGDICVFNATSSNKYGHICIATGTGTTSYFYSFDQNYGTNKSVRKVKHSYSAFLGVLRPKVVANISSAPKPESYKVNVNTFLNVRAKPNGAIVAKLKNGDKVDVFEKKDGWARIGTNKWVSADYLSKN